MLQICCEVFPDVCSTPPCSHCVFLISEGLILLHIFFSSNPICLIMRGPYSLPYLWGFGVSVNSFSLSCCLTCLTLLVCSIFSHSDINLCSYSSTPDHFPSVVMMLPCALLDKSANKLASCSAVSQEESWKHYKSITLPNPTQALSVSTQC